MHDERVGISQGLASPSHLIDRHGSIGFEGAGYLAEYISGLAIAESTGPSLHES